MKAESGVESTLIIDEVCVIDGRSWLLLAGAPCCIRLMRIGTDDWLMVRRETRRRTVNIVWDMLDEDCSIRLSNSA